MTPLDLNTIIQRNEKKFLANPLGDETVMMNTDNGDYLGLNSVATDIWSLLKEPRSVQNLLSEIAHLYDVSEEKCTAEVTIFLNKMVEQDMLIRQRV